MYDYPVRGGIWHICSAVESARERTRGYRRSGGGDEEDTREKEEHKCLWIFYGIPFSILAITHETLLPTRFFN